MLNKIFQTLSVSEQKNLHPRALNCNKWQQEVNGSHVCFYQKGKHYIGTYGPLNELWKALFVSNSQKKIF